MPRIPLHPVLLALAAAGLSARPGLAQTVHALRSDRALAAPGETVTLGLTTTRDGVRTGTAWPADDARAWLFVRAAGTQENMEHVTLVGQGVESGARLALPHADANLIGLDLAAREEVVTAESWRRFASEHLVGAPPVPDRALRVARTESLKLVLRVASPGAEAGPSATALSKSGQAFELRPLVDPTVTPVGADLPLKLYVPEGPSAGLVVTARHLATGAVERATTRPGGTVHLPVTQPGAWTVEAHVALPGPADGVDVVLLSSTLVYEIPSSGSQTPETPRDGGRR